jgi:hypothetical protein
MSTDTSLRPPKGSTALYRLAIRSSPEHELTRAEEVAEVESIAAQLASAMSQYRWDDPLLSKHLSPQLRTQWDDILTIPTREAYLQHSRAIHEEYGYGFEILNMSTVVHNGGRSATQWLTAIIRGLPFENRSPMVARETVARLSWRKRNGVW